MSRKIKNQKEMKKVMVFFGVLLSLLVLANCNVSSNDNKNVDKASDSTNLQANQLNDNSNSGNDKNKLSVNGSLSKDTIAELLNQLKNIPPGENYLVIGELKTDILKYKSMEFGDLLHLGFIDKNNKEYDFNNNITKVELYKDAANPSDENGGYEANKKYLNKNFRVFWRTVKLKHKPKDEMEMYYEVYDEIIYLKQIN
jgi:hypothetical protein